MNPKARLFKISPELIHKIYYSIICSDISVPYGMSETDALKSLAPA
ncbi:MAG: hypothetical protein IPK61_08355 [Saprospiraceae bacterium]|nr:hypothetical protein [Saprospiraceae bacterium]